MSHTATVLAQPATGTSSTPIKTKKKNIKDRLSKEHDPDRFNAPDADITFQSVDGIMYRIHRKNLECSSGAFPAAEFESKKDEVVPMPEHSEVLDLLFTFMYPERQPNLKKISFRVLADLAEAAEKYEVFSAIATCNTHMVAETEKHPLDILVYAAKHGYLELLDKAATMVIGQSLDSAIDRMPPAIAIAWVRYYQKWRDVYTKATARPSNCTCGAWYPNCTTILDKFGGKVESLSNIDDVFQLPSVNNCCSTHIRTWRNNANNACSTVPKFSTLL
ncbi:hypothetical protein F5887DRAFT_131777 [Amanita rubescens]|nr:hypothetical protein F5887DRAFT_131777 [Amanita rubescens]